jgi:hypothetical protein
MMKVGRDYIKVGEKERKFAYRDIQFDPDGWADAKKFLPADYDLMFLKIKDKKSSCGWSVGTKWDGLKLNQDDEILYWKKKPDENVKCKAVLQ